MSIHVPSSKQPPDGLTRDDQLFDTMTEGETRFDFSSLESTTIGLSGPPPDDDGFIIAFSLTPAIFSEPK